MTGNDTTTLRSYQVVRELARGEHTATLVARDANGREVVLKTLEPVGGDQGARFLEEARLLRQLAHPSLVRLFDYGRASDGTCFMTMEYVGGGSLERRLRAGEALPTVTALRITRQVADALAFIHTRGVVHRDIKPANIMLRGEPGAEEATVVDFGLARVGGAAASSPHVTGSAGYLAPELIANPRLADPRADVFALGTVLGEMMLTGKQFPVEIQTIVTRCREPAPHDRFPSMTALRMALDRILEPPTIVSPVVARIALALPRSIDESLTGSTRADLIRALEEDLGSVLADLGLQGRVACALAPAGDDFEMRIEGHRRGFSDGLAQRIRCAIEGAPASTVADRDDLLVWLAGAPEATRRDFLRHLAVAVVTAAPDLLVTASVVEGYLPGLRNAAGVDLADAETVRQVLAEVAGLQISVADVAAVAAAWKRVASSSRAEIVEEIVAAVRPDAIELRLAPGEFRRLVETGSTFSAQFDYVRHEVYRETGVWVPTIRFVQDGRIAAGTFRIRLRHLDGPPQGILPADRSMILLSDGFTFPDRIQVLHPVRGSELAMCIVPTSQVPETVKRWGALDTLVLDVAACLFADGWRLIDRHGVDGMLDDLAASHSAAVALHSEHGDRVGLTRVLRGLAREGISIRDLLRVLISQLDFDTVLTRPQKDVVLADALPVTVEGPVDTDEETRRRLEFARMTLSSGMQDTFAPDGTFTVVALDPGVAALSESAEPDSDDAVRITKAVRAVHPTTASWRRQCRGVAILTHVGIRARVRAILEADLPHVPVLALTELPPECKVQVIARAGLSE